MPTIDPRRGEIWRVNLEPAFGAEMRKARPVVVLSRDSVRKLPLRLVVPLTEMQPHFAGQSWKVRIDPDPSNGLTKASAADAIQSRGVDLMRFINGIGVLPGADMAEIAKAVALLIDFHP